MASGQITVFADDGDRIGVQLIELNEGRSVVVIRVGLEIISIHLNTEQLGEFTPQAGAL